jgi:hypothetical protein
MSKFILDNWEDYESDKIARGLDPTYFSCDERWECEYLKNKILEHYPGFSERVVAFAIYFTCSRTAVPQPRLTLIEQVTRLLEISVA